MHSQSQKPNSDKEYVRVRGKALLGQIVDDFGIVGKLSYNDEQTRMRVFQRITELVELEKSKLTPPEQYLVREYVREGLIGNLDPDERLDARFAEEIQIQATQHEIVTSKRGSLMEKLVFYSLPQNYANTTPFKKVVGVMLLFAGVTICFVPLVWYLTYISDKGPLAFFLTARTWVAAFGFPIMGVLVAYIFIRSAFSRWLFRRIRKQKELEYQKILDDRHGK